MTNPKLPESPLLKPAFRVDWRYMAAIFAFVLIGLWAFGYDAPLPGSFDAAAYWEVAGDFVRTGHFSLIGFKSGLRGYLYPLLLVVPRVLVYFGKLPHGCMEIFLGAVQAALLFGWILPALYSCIRPNSNFSAQRKIAFAALGLFFWGGYFGYTLTDFPATLAFAGSLLLMLSHGPRWWVLLLSGALLGAALNARPFYLVSVPVVVLIAGNLPINHLGRGGASLAKRDLGPTWNNRAPSAAMAS